MQRLGKLAKKHRNGQIKKVIWLDRPYNFYFHCFIMEPEGDKNYKFLSKPKLVTVPDSEILQENLVERKHHRLARRKDQEYQIVYAKPTASIRDQLHTIVYRYRPLAGLSAKVVELAPSTFIVTQRSAILRPNCNMKRSPLMPITYRLNSFLADE
ncbi:hypothetical protein DOY81_010905 [Sarcophaga bullata]|nr:hypothetical protein DOY81_010905 [Sarcophaga bullata]